MEKRAGEVAEKVGQNSARVAAQDAFKNEMNDISKIESMEAEKSMAGLLEELVIAIMPDSSPCLKQILAVKDTGSQGSDSEWTDVEDQVPDIQLRNQDGRMSSETNVKYNFLGKSGVKVSNICLGTLTFGKVTSVAKGPFAVFYGNPRHTNEADSHKILDRYVELGGNFLDTADMYSDGESEKIIGTWLKKQKRDNIIIASKVGNSFDFTSQNSFGLSRRHIMKSCEESLERLQTDYIDLYQAHLWDKATSIEETLCTFDDLIKMGKIRYYGFSNVCGWQMQKIVETTKHLNLNPCISLQQQYSLLQRDSELEAFMVCETEGICVLPWSPLKGGMLTGKFKRNQEPDAIGSRVGYIHANRKSALIKDWEVYGNNDKYWTLITVIEQIAKAHGKTVPQVALRWLLHKDMVSSVIIGCTSIQQLEDNMGASGGWEISLDEMKEIEEAAPLSMSYPYDILCGVIGRSRMNRFNDSSKL